MGAIISKPDTSARTIMALEQAWNFLKAAGREHTGSPSRTIAPTGGGSKLDRYGLTALRLRDEKARRTAAKLRVSNSLGGPRRYQEPPRLRGYRGNLEQPVEEDWGDKEYQQYFSEIPKGVGDANPAKPRGPYSPLSRGPRSTLRVEGATPFAH